MSSSKKHKKTPEEGSETAKSGFKNEVFVKDVFNEWKKKELAKKWLMQMGYKIDSVKSINAVLGREINQGIGKSDVIVTIDGKIEGISIKKFSASFNQIDKRWADNYVPLWNIPKEVLIVLKKYSGEKGFQPKDILNDEGIKKLRDKRRFHMDELSQKEQKMVLDFFTNNLNPIITDLLKGRDSLIANWLLVIKYNNGNVSDSKIISINDAIKHYSTGNVTISKKGTIKIGKITLQRKGGDGGRETAQMLQFKFSPNEILKLDEIFRRTRIRTDIS